MYSHTCMSVLGKTSNPRRLLMELCKTLVLVINTPAQYFVPKPTSRQCFTFAALCVTEAEARDSLLRSPVSPSQ